jgi:hypothetical protein
MNNSNYTRLIQKLDAFVRKYYKNQLLRGLVYFSLATLLGFLLIVVLEYFGRYSQTVRATMFYSFLLLSVYCLVKFIVIPLTGMYKLGKTMSYEYASLLIGKHFPEVKDRLLNTLQLKQDAVNSSNAVLLEAAISQKIEQLSPIPFTEAINLKQNLKHARLVLIPVGIYVLIYVFNPGVITKGTERVVKYNTTFVPEAPFNFILDNTTLKTHQFSDYQIDLSLSGQSIPDEVYVDVDGVEYKMQKVTKTKFAYTLRNVNKDVDFVFKAAGFHSQAYVLKVVQKPTLLHYQVKLQYPAYIGKRVETVDNPGDLSVPAGTVATWTFNSSQTDEVLLTFEQTETSAEKKNQEQFTFSKKLTTSTPYFIKNKNNNYGVADSLAYAINIIPDAHPQISVEEKADSLTGKQLYFIGDASDDYGLTKLVFAYRFMSSETDDKVKQGLQTKVLALQKGEKSQRFYHQFNLNEVGINASDELEYYFEVWDNDGVQGAKSTRSKPMVFKAPSAKEFRSEMNDASKNLKNEMQEAINESKKLQKELKDLQLKMLEKRELTWEEKKKAEELLKRQKDLMAKIDDIKKQNQKNNIKENEFKELNPELVEKQKLLEKMFNELMDDEMKKLLKDMEKMLQQQNKDAMKQEMDKMEMNNKDVEKELDRMLEQYKQLEVEKKIDEATKQLKSLAEKQKELAQKTEKTENDKTLSKEEKQQQLEEIKKEQEKLNNEFKDVQQQLKEAEQKNKELENPKELANTKEEEKKIANEQQEAKESLDKKDSKKAKEKQQKAAEEMEEMANKMQEKQEQEEQEQHEEDADALREILENTIQLSKDQEVLIEEMRKLNGYSPQYVELAKQQKVTRDNAKIIEDSLLALSKRVPEIRSFINREVTKLNDNLDKSVAAYGVRNFMEIRTRQQYAMTHANNLAVMLSQALDQKQQQNQQSKSAKSGKGKPKPGKGSGSKPMSMSQLKKRQEELNKQLREGLNKQGDKGQPKPGEKPGDKPGQKPGGVSGQGQGNSSEQIARMAAEQMAIRQQLQRMMQQMDAKQKEGLGGQKALEDMKRMMEQTEKELYNKNLTTQMLQRQQEILTRLLESEKAERKQDEEQKREAEQAKDRQKPTPPDFEQYIQQKNKEKELLETIPADMQQYYKDKSKEYFNKIGK